MVCGFDFPFNDLEPIQCSTGLWKTKPTWNTWNVDTLYLSRWRQEVGRKMRFLSIIQIIVAIFDEIGESSATQWFWRQHISAHTSQLVIPGKPQQKLLKTLQVFENMRDHEGMVFSVSTGYSTGFHQQYLGYNGHDYSTLRTLGKQRPSLRPA